MMQKKKERHVVTWTQEEDDTLREIIELHGTENWTIIASKFKGKTTRQCRRRWYTYLNSDFKKGGWSPEEDLLLFEAQRIFGNRWTEISKVVSGRTDNAVKNRFTTLCKRRAKHEAMTKENNMICMNSNSKRVLSQNGFYAETTPTFEFSAKKMRIRDMDFSVKRCDSVANQPEGTPCLMMANSVAAQNRVEDDVSNGNILGGFLKKTDPKIMSALMQQAELLTSLAQKVNEDNTQQSMENAWKVVQDFLNKSKENDIFRYDVSYNDFQLDNYKDLRSRKEELLLSWRQPGLYESPASSESSRGSTILPNPAVDKTKQTQAETAMMSKQDGCGQQSSQVEHEKKAVVTDANTNRVDLISAEEEFCSPLQVTPLFRSLAAGIPSPQFSESERNFLLKTLGIESPFPSPGANSLQPPACKRVLLHSL